LEKYWLLVHVVDGLHLRHRLEPLLQLVLLSLGGGPVPLALRLRARLDAQVDRQLDLALPVGSRPIHLLDEQQARAEQGQADGHHHDERHGHGEIPAQPDPDLLQDEM
jgi:hypothetical protein